MIDEIKQFFKKNEPEFALMIGVILVSLISFAAGRLTAPGFEKQPIEIQYPESASLKDSVNSNPENSTNNNTFQELKDSKDKAFEPLQARQGGAYVASKNSDKYHLPECPGVKRIAEHNKIWFLSKEEAESMGYEPAGNCPGLK